eukprot:8291178-Alexandrium_andersonii.AAC.1
MRTVVLDGLAADGVLPARGITAGCFSATYVLKVYLAKLVRRQQARHPEVGCVVHVDDFGLEAAGARPWPTA